MNSAQSPTGSPVFSLETDDRTVREKELSKKKNGKRGLGVEGPAVPMESNFQEEMEPQKPKIMLNLSVVKELLGIEEENQEEREMKRFDIRRLFEAAASGEVMMLDGLHQYLHQNQKKLSNSEYRSYGKNALMKGLLNMRDGKNNTVEYLLEIAQRMGDVTDFVNAAYTDVYYKGNTALHIATERRSMHYVQLLVSRGANVHARACGKFFQQQEGPSFYFGELPSPWRRAQPPNMVDYLMENEHQRADVQEQDSHGNTVLHALVLVADNSRENTDFVTAMYDHILAGRAPPPQGEAGGHGEPARADSHQTGRQDGKDQGTFLNTFCTGVSVRPHQAPVPQVHRVGLRAVHSSLFDLADLDSCQDQSVLEILVYGSDIPNRHEMLQIAPLSKLLDEKWSRFARYIFVFYFWSTGLSSSSPPSPTNKKGTR
ncbi:Transient receptor potential cation channel subfamily V member 2 [Merluccius polli]|uniref:Transient receptor potential cation channel subfamily V member 2 n=1 Tax=Merluccius polli TaxID=89951 RepID=A0AA47MTX1_MERPO|nr:Transient receptor potential cation channel subfamily V member 2 [Merluccius polli]